MRTPVEDREVTINLIGNEASIYCSDYHYMIKLDRCCENNPDEWKCTNVATSDGDVVSKTYSCPAKYISFRSKPRSGSNGRKITPEQLERMQEGRRRAIESRNL